MALANGDVRLYDAEKNLLHTLKTMETIAALRFGPYAREDGALAVVSTAGGRADLAARVRNNNVSMHSLRAFSVARRCVLFRSCLFGVVQAWSCVSLMLYVFLFRLYNSLYSPCVNVFLC